MLLLYMVLTNATVMVARACITTENRLFNYILHMVPISKKVPQLIHVFWAAMSLLLPNSISVSSAMFSRVHQCDKTHRQIDNHAMSKHW